MDSNWKHCVNRISNEDGPYLLQAMWSIPTRRRPIPNATASVFFKVQSQVRWLAWENKLDPRNHAFSYSRWLMHTERDIDTRIHIYIHTLSLSRFSLSLLSLSVCLSICLSLSLYVSLSIHLAIYLLLYPSICLSIYLSIDPSLFLSLPPSPSLRHPTLKTQSGPVFMHRT